VSDSGKIAVVTGTSTGIGFATALQLAAHGHHVFAGMRNLGKAEPLREAARKAGVPVEVIELDVTSADSVTRAFAAAAARGPVDVLVNNAGWERLALFVESEPALWDRLIAINLKGPLHVTHAVLPGMIARRRGRIVSIASDAGRVGSTGEAVYSACKAGVIGFTKSLAREVARHGITVNAVCPGPTDTALLASVMEGERGQKVLAGMQRAIPLGRLAQPDDVAGAVAYLASDEAAYVTGQTLSVSGGLTMHG